jgi:hypothetical protein
MAYISEDRLRQLLATPEYKGLVDKGAAWMTDVGDESGSEAVHREAAIRFIVMKCEEYARVDRTGYLNTEERLLDEIDKKVRQGFLFAEVKEEPAKTSAPIFGSKMSPKTKKIMTIVGIILIVITIIEYIIMALVR